LKIINITNKEYPLDINFEPEGGNDL